MAHQPVASGTPPSEPVGLDAGALSTVCPFHLVWDGEGRLVQVGPAAARLVPGASVGALVGDCLVTRSSASSTLAVLVSTRDERVTLKGQLLDGGTASHPLVLFFGAPVVGDEDALTALGLSLQDFPPHAGLPDFLLATRAQRTALAEARALSERLTALNAELEKRVSERTRSLTESRDRLAVYALQVEDVSEKLRRESAERERVEADLRLAHKLEAVGQLAAGIAHEINTPVQFVGDNLRFLGRALTDLGEVLDRYSGLADAARALLGMLPAGPAVAATAAAVGRLDAAVAAADLPFLLEEGPRAVAESIDGTERVGQIVRAMKEFAHPDAGELTPSDLNRSVETTLIVARNEYRHVADLVVELDPGLPLVPCVVGEINQVLLNLVVNAAHAVADAQRAGPRAGERGTITVSTLAVAGAVELRVADTGCGIPPHVQPRIFDPFFTTKEVGRGTGQGLAVCHSIVTVRHHGRLTFSTEPGRGTTFVVRLPLESSAA